MQGPSGRGTGHSRCGRRCDQPSASGGEAWSMAGQARRRRSALAALCVVPPRAVGGHVHGRTFTCPHLGSVYLYLRRSETGLPLPEAPQASPTGVDRELRKSEDATHFATDGPAPRRYDGDTAAARVRVAVFVRSEYSNALVGDGVPRFRRARRTSTAPSVWHASSCCTAPASPPLA